MSLYTDLQDASSEEDVKDIYIKHLKLKNYTKGLVDIRKKEIWFEAKKGYKVSTYEMFTQLLFYVAEAMDKTAGLFYEAEIPPFLCVIDQKKAALMETAAALPLLQDKRAEIKWGQSASDVTKDAVEVISQYIGVHVVSFNLQFNEAEFIEAVQTAIKTGKIIRTQITPDNLKQVFDKWVEMIGREIKNVREDDFALLFYADVMSDGNASTHENLSAELLHKGTKPVFAMGGRLYELGSAEGYRKFWAIYDRPPKEEYRNYLLERRDSLIPTDERSFKGAYYTPLNVVDRAYELLSRTLGAGWQKEYIVWDMCCGVGNLETKHSNHRAIYMSTLDQADVDVMKAAKTCVAAERFQYDYLNDDIADDGSIDYSLTEKIPQSLRKIISEAKSGKKKILVLINPPYAEVGSGIGKGDKNGLGKTKVSKFAMTEYGKASNELFTQFVARIAKEIPNATLAMFSKLKYINSQAFEKFRKVWSAKYIDGFVVHSKSFDGLKGNFPIGFLIWKTDNRENVEKTLVSEVTCEVLDKNVQPVGEKTFYSFSENQYLSNWIERPPLNDEIIIPLKNAISPATRTTDLRCKTWSDGAIGYLFCNGNDFAHSSDTAIFSSGYGGGHGFYINSDNLDKAAVVFAVRKLISPTWLNDRDQFLQPTKELSEEFRNDCLVWMLFNGSNLTAGADGLEWNGRKWSVTNHFIPFTETEVDAPERFESDFMVQYMSEKEFSAEARAVLDEGRRIWRAFFATDFDHKIRSEFRLNRSDAGWYQIRMALKAWNEQGDNAQVSFSAFEKSYAALTDKLHPKVWEYGFLRG